MWNRTTPDLDRTGQDICASKECSIDFEILLRFETEARQRRLRSKIEDKFRTFRLGKMGKMSAVYAQSISNVWSYAEFTKFTYTFCPCTPPYFFTGGKKCKFWARFSTPVALDVFGFQNEAIYQAFSTSAWSDND